MAIYQSTTIKGNSYYECVGLEAQLKALAKKYGEIPDKVLAPASRSALNKAAVTVRKETAQAVAANINAKVNPVRRRIKVWKAKSARKKVATSQIIGAKLSFVVSDLSSAHLKNFRQVKAGVKTKRGMLPGKFVLRNLKHSKRAIAERDGSRLKFYKVPISRIGEAAMEKIIDRRAGRYMVKEISREVKARLSDYWKKHRAHTIRGGAHWL